MQIRTSCSGRMVWVSIFGVYGFWRWNHDILLIWGHENAGFSYAYFTRWYCSYLVTDCLLQLHSGTVVTVDSDAIGHSYILIACKTFFWRLMGLVHQFCRGFTMPKYCADSHQMELTMKLVQLLLNKFYPDRIYNDYLPELSMIVSLILTYPFIVLFSLLPPIL